MAETKVVEKSGRLYGRKWRVVIYKKTYIDDPKNPGQKIRDTKQDIAIDVSMLRCVFKTQQKLDTPATVCTLEIYNMDAATEAETIREGWQISIEAGYQQGQYGFIFVGDIMQIIRNRENGIDYKLEIIALNGSMLFDINYVRTTLSAGCNPREVVNSIGKRSQQTIILSDISDNLNEQRLTRAKVLFGTPSKYLRDLGVGNNAYYWAGTDDKLNFKKIADVIPDDHCLVLAPNNTETNSPNLGGLVGTPQYGDDGIKIKMLLEPRIKMFGLVKIDNSAIRTQLMSPEFNKKTKDLHSQQSEFDKDGEYQVFAIEHNGDTNGNEWFTNIIGIGRLGRNGKLLTEKEQERKK